MKNNILILLCSLPLLINAQQFRYGAHISPAMNWWDIEGDLYVSTGSQFGVQVGFIADLTLGKSERFAITSGLSYDLTAGGFEENKESNDIKSWDFGVSYLDVPFTIRLRSDQLNNSFLYAQYGVNFGFAIASKANGESLPYKGLEYEKQLTSLTMGFGLERIISDDKYLLFGVYFQNGITNVLIDKANDDNMYPQQIGLRFGLLL